MSVGPAEFALAIASGKGGVGKSTISLNLALALAARGRRVGLLDADFYGPDIPLMVGLSKTEPLLSWALWRRAKAGRGGVRLEPLERHGLRIMSVGLLLAEHQALSWPAEIVEFVGRQFLHQVEWGDLDYLVVDLPPGTGDIQQQLFRLLSISGAVIVVTPQDAAHLDANRVLEMLREYRIRVLGGVENMAGLVCPHCGGHTDVFPTVERARAIWAQGVKCLETIPLDPSVARAAEAGEPASLAHPEGPAADSFRRLAAAVVAELESGPRPTQL